MAAWHWHKFTKAAPLVVIFDLPWARQVFWWRRVCGIRIGHWFIGAFQGAHHHDEPAPQREDTP